ncbi:hypothetical protein L21SP2_1536 [Salinispira pacifica]|uniref:Uncharacterized protein n=1 Tax=Salinispira pacifica TaxID=1307761 RepID=V5WH95_9SPIO|nr:hypothetical protein L21SP2_1536 [Salinispira pacifica]
MPLSLRRIFNMYHDSIVHRIGKAMTTLFRISPVRAGSQFSGYRVL